MGFSRPVKPGSCPVDSANTARPARQVPLSAPTASARWAGTQPRSTWPTQPSLATNTVIGKLRRMQFQPRFAVHIGGRLAFQVLFGNSTSTGRAFQRRPCARAPHGDNRGVAGSDGGGAAGRVRHSSSPSSSR